MWLARFYVARQRYSEAEPLFQKALEIHEEDRGPTSYLPHHLQEFAKLYELQGKYEEAETQYRRAVVVCEQLHGAKSLLTVQALEALAAFCRARPLRRGRRALPQKSRNCGGIRKISGCSAVERLATLAK
jgi:tetratricopeptide (TPR) repeat protein